MKLHFSPPKFVFVLASTVIIIAFSAFTQKGKTGRYSFRKTTNTTIIDTPTPLIHDRYITLDDLESIESSLKKLDERIDKLNERMNTMSLDRVGRDINGSRQKVDFDKIERQINESFKKIELEKIDKDLRGGIARVENLNRMKSQMEIAKAQLEIRKANMALNRNEVKVNVEKAMRNARESMMKAREELSSLKEFMGQLEKDGLINRSKPDKIEVKSGELYINDKKQTNEVNDRYRRYYRKDNFIINLNEEGIRI